jgi:hypothetical protein
MHEREPHPPRRAATSRAGDHHRSGAGVDDDHVGARALPDHTAGATRHERGRRAGGIGIPLVGDHHRRRDRGNDDVVVATRVPRRAQ